MSAAGPGSGADLVDGPRGVPWRAWSPAEYEARLPALTSLVGLRRHGEGLDR